MDLEVCRLSDKKICIHNTVEIKFNDNHIGYFDISTRYVENINFKDADLKMIYTDRFIVKLSNKYGIKKKHISMLLKSTDVLFDNKNYINTKIIHQIQFSDSNWYVKYNRDLKIKQLFS